MTARMPCRSSSSNAANTLTKVNIRIQFLLVYGNCNRMSLISGNAACAQKKAVYNSAASAAVLSEI